MLVAGIMSGTSVDGIDVALVDIRGEGFKQKVRPVAFHSIEYASDVRQAILGVCDSKTDTRQVSQINFLLGQLFGEAVIEACDRAEIPPGKIELVGSHGQTIYHQPVPARLCGRDVVSTLQIGEPALISAKINAPVVADFRTADMALGGQGAPLVPYVDYVLYRHARRGRVALNIGGIANLTAIQPKAEPSEVMAFDTGPGNMIVDALVSQFSRGTMSFDRDGKMAAAGTVSHELLSDLMRDPFLSRAPPKSCGREQYGPEFVANMLRQGLPAADLVATITAFTAASIADAVERFVRPRMKVDDLIVSGGGVKNPEIMARLRAQFPETQVNPSDEFGIDSDAKEAVAFAVLAYESFHGRPANLPSATGASRTTILGKLIR